MLFLLSGYLCLILNLIQLLADKLKLYGANKTGMRETRRSHEH